MQFFVNKVPIIHNPEIHQKLENDNIPIPEPHIKNTTLFHSI